MGARGFGRGCGLGAGDTPPGVVSLTEFVLVGVARNGRRCSLLTTGPAAPPVSSGGTICCRSVRLRRVHFGRFSPPLPPPRCLFWDTSLAFPPLFPPRCLLWATRISFLPSPSHRCLCFFLPPPLRLLPRSPFWFPTGRRVRPRCRAVSLRPPNPTRHAPPQATAVPPARPPRHRRRREAPRPSRLLPLRRPALRRRRWRLAGRRRSRPGGAAAAASAVAAAAAAARPPNPQPLAAAARKWRARRRVGPHRRRARWRPQPRPPPRAAGPPASGGTGPVRGRWRKSASSKRAPTCSSPARRFAASSARSVCATCRRCAGGWTRLRRCRRQRRTIWFTSSRTLCCVQYTGGG